MAKFDAEAAGALEVIREVGAEIILTRMTETAFDPVTETSSTNPVSGTVWAVEIPPGKSAELRIGSLIGRRVLQLYIARFGSSFEPKVGDTFTWKGDVYSLIPPLTHYDPAGDGAVLTVAYAER